MVRMKEYIRKSAIDLGIDLIGFAKANNFTEFESFYDKRIKNNYLSDVGNIRDIKKRLAVQEVMADAKSIIAIALSYNNKLDKPDNISDKGIISPHVFSVDYHVVLQNKMNELINCIKEKYKKDFQYKCFCDTGILDDRIIAYKAGIGFFGKNNFIINEKYGSYLFLGHILTNLNIEPDSPVDNLCGDCRTCLESCESHALNGEFSCNAKICISNLSQKKALSQDEQKLLGKHIYGCDVCQNVCRFNKNAVSAKNDCFKAKTEDIYIYCDDILSMTKEDFDIKYKNTALYWRGYEVIKRNAQIVKNNIFDYSIDEGNNGGKHES